MNLSRVWDKAREIFKDLQLINRNKATDLPAFEVMELENIFILLLLGSFTGMPSSRLSRPKAAGE